jgi:hypothetical protein
VQYLTAHRLKDHVDAAGRRQPHLLGPVGLGVVDGDVGAQLLEKIELGRRTCGGDDGPGALLLG